MRPTRLIAAATAVLALPAAAVAAAPPPTPAGEPIVIALEGPLSGPQASTGQDMLRGVRLAVDQANAAGGVLGRRVVIHRADDRADPARARAAARAAVAAGAVAVIGPYNSSVGIINLPDYLRARVVPVQLTSTDQTTGLGVTVQPKNSQIAPVEARHILARRPGSVAMLVDPSEFTQSQADRLRKLLVARGVNVSTVPVTAGKASYAAEVAQALTDDPDTVYVSTYFPEGGRIARALAAEAARGNPASCFMGLANVDPAFVRIAGAAAARPCRFSGVPAAGQLPSARAYVAAYRRAFAVTPGVWGTFTYDSANILFRAMRRTAGTAFTPALTALRNTRGVRGATGVITIDPRTGNRPNVPLGILRVTPAGTFVIAG